MLRTALATHALTIGFATLALLTLPVMAAQLPDAPLAVTGPQTADAAISSGVAHDVPGDSPAIGASWTHVGWVSTFNLSATEVLYGVYDSESHAAWNPPQLAFNAGFAAGYQQSLYRPSRETPLPGFSSSVAERHPIPGAAPAVQNACPRDSCSLAQNTMCCGQAPSPFERYLKSPGAVPLTARDNLHSAVKGVIDPFNLLTIAGDAAISVALDPDSPYGPGFEGFSKYAGVSLTENMTGEFFGTFLIPSLVHQGPHYHREPYVSIKRRILHAFTQVVWAQSYTGRPMFNYGNIVGGIATAVVSNTFVPGPGRQRFSSTAQRLAIAFAISPSSNLIEEFLPDISNRINLRVVIFQRILNRVTYEESGTL